MSDVVKAVLGGVVIGALAFFTGGAGLLGTTTLLGSVGAGAVLGGVTGILGVLSRPKIPDLSSEFGRELQLNGDPTAVRKIAYGEVWTAGTLRFHGTVGDNNEDLYLVIVLAGCEIDSVQEAEFDGDELTLDGSGDVTSPSKWAGLINVRYYLGTDDQTADATLVSEFAEWTTDHRLRGLAYAIVKLTFDEEDLNAMPQMRFNLHARKVYDQRLDSTVPGGSGTHRLDDPDTWAWSRNAALCTADFMRGVKVNSRAIAGMRVADTRFDSANVIAEANVCDEAVTLDAGGTQDRYTVDGFIDPRQDHGQNLRHFELAFAGDATFADGKWRLFAGAFRSPTLHLEDKHFIGPLQHTVHKGEAQRVDTAQGSFASASDSGDVLDYPPVRLDSAVVGEERIFPLTFALVSNGARAQRCAKLLLEREAAGKRITCTTSLYGYRAVPGETINITHSAFGLSTQAMRVLDAQLTTVQVDDNKVGLVTNLVLEAGPSSLYTWNAEETVIAAAPVIPQAQVPFNIISFGNLANAIINPGYEAGDVGWTKGTGWTIVEDAANAHLGSWVAKITDGSGSPSIANSFKLPLEEGERILAHMRMKKTAGSAALRVRVIFRDAADAQVGSTAFGNNVTGSTYELSRVIATAPATTDYAEFTPNLGGGDGTDDGFADDAFMAIIPKNADIDIGEASGAVDTSRIDLNAATEVVYVANAGPESDTSPDTEPGTKTFFVETVNLDIDESTDEVFVIVSCRMEVTGSIDFVSAGAFVNPTGEGITTNDSFLVEATGEYNFALQASFSGHALGDTQYGLSVTLAGNPPSTVTTTFRDINLTVARFKR